MVLNLAPLTVAVSHHFLSAAGLHTTLRLLRDFPHRVSGIDRGLARDERSAAVAAANPDAAGPPHAMGSADPAGRAADLIVPNRDDDDHARRRAAGAALHDHLVAALRQHRPDALNAAELLLGEERSMRSWCSNSMLRHLVSPAATQPLFSFNFT